MRPNIKGGLSFEDKNTQYWLYFKKGEVVERVCIFDVYPQLGSEEGSE